LSGDPSGLFVLFFVVAIGLAIGNFVLRARYGITNSQRRSWGNRPWGWGPGPWNQGPGMPPNQPWNSMSGPPYGPTSPYGPDPGLQAPGFAPQPDSFASPDCGPGAPSGGFDGGSMGGGFGGSCDPGPSSGFSGGDSGGGTAGSIQS